MSERIPIIILGGSDSKPGPVPAGLTEQEMLRGYKAAHRLPSGQSLVEELVVRLRESDQFQEPILLGPKQVYEASDVDCELVDVDGDLSKTLDCVRQVTKDRFDTSRPVAFITCDVLPSVAEIRQLLSESYAPHADCYFWGQLVESSPEEMGASSWKPSYEMRPAAEEEPVNLYPGHLVVLRPEAVRMQLMTHLLRLAYQHRNVDLTERPAHMLTLGLGRLVLQDLYNLFHLQAPVLSVSIPYHALYAYARYQGHDLSVPEFADAVAGVFLHRAYLRRCDGHPAVFSVTQLRSFAKDIDTRTELAEAGGEW